MNKDNYLKKFLESAPIALALIRAIECKLMDNIPFTSPILDVGCGDGLFSSILFKNKFLIDSGIDCDENEVNLCYKRGVYKEIKVAYVEDIPYNDETFKFVLANDVLNYVKDIKIALNEIWRVLMPNGFFCFTVPTLIPKMHINFIWHFIKNHSLTKIISLLNHDISSYFRLNTILKFKEWSNLLKDCGFKIIFYRRYASLSTIFVQFITSFYLYKAIAYKQILGRYIPFPTIHENIITPITSKLLESLYNEDKSYKGENYLFLVQKICD